MLSNFPQEQEEEQEELWSVIDLRRASGKNIKKVYKLISKFKDYSTQLTKIYIEKF